LGTDKWELIKFTFATDHRGDLMAIDLENQLPFVPKRFFSTYNVPGNAIRGAHAHTKCQQVLIALSGKLLITLDSGSVKQDFILDNPSIGLYVQTLVWSTQESILPGSVLGVFASHLYDESDYVREYELFRMLV
jgi:UDP-2-acetamido-3-amino-2,3-dideoxy-glucuronate N-acetyltransferase